MSIQIKKILERYFIFWSHKSEIERDEAMLLMKERRKGSQIANEERVEKVRKDILQFSFSYGEPRIR